MKNHNSLYHRHRFPPDIIKYVNRHSYLTHVTSEISITWRADRRRSHAPIHSVTKPKNQLGSLDFSLYFYCSSRIRAEVDSQQIANTTTISV